MTAIAAPAGKPEELATWGISNGSRSLEGRHRLEHWAHSLTSEDPFRTLKWGWPSVESSIYERSDVESALTIWARDYGIVVRPLGGLSSTFLHGEGGARFVPASMDDSLTEPSSSLRFQFRLNEDPVDRMFREITAETTQRDRIKTIRNKLGARAAERFSRFMEYEDGWDGGRGKSLDPGSTASLMQLLSLIDLSTHDVGLFMSLDGNVVLNWTMADGSLVEIELAPEAVNVYVERSESDITIPFDEEQIRNLPIFRDEATAG
ncbi:MAG: hypothetical protein AB7U35_06225 [Sphingobium sp.]